MDELTDRIMQLQGINKKLPLVLVVVVATMTRRPTVNFMNQGTANKIANGEPDAKDYCPSCGSA